MTTEKIREFTVRVTNANKTEMIVILYDMGIQYIDDAVSALNVYDMPLFRTEIGRIRNVLRELMASVDTSKNLGMNILRLYIYSSGELTRGYLDYSAESLNHVKNIFMHLREAYAEQSPKDTSGPVMQNAERVYNGFTYNRNSMSENLADTGINRGILA